MFCRKRMEQLKDNIALIGMPGCGKSSLGVVLAKALGYKFVDSDLLIQEREGKLLNEIIEQDGLDTFKKIEEEVNSSIKTSKTVIATGGSVVYGPAAMAHLRDIATVVYLKLPLEEIASRLGDLNQRGVALQPGQTLAELYDERIPLYEKYADLIIDITDMDIRQSVAELISQTIDTVSDETISERVEDLQKKSDEVVDETKKSAECS